MIRKIINSFALALGNIRSNLFHTILSVLGIVIGVAALVSILSLIDGMEKFARQQIATTTSLNGIVVQSDVFKRVNEVRVRKDTVSVIDYEKYTTLKSSLTKSFTAYIRYSFSDEVTLVSGKKVGAILLATDFTLEPGFSDTSKFTNDHIINRERLVIVNQTFLKAANLSESDALSQKLVITKDTFQITQVLQDLSSTPRIYYPITIVAQADLQKSPPEIIIEAKKTEDVSLLKAEISDWLMATYGKSQTDFVILTNSFRIEQATRGFLLFRVIMGLIVGISVLVGGIGVMNVLLISVTERTAEIGIRKAMGASRRDIILLFLSESITVSVFGSLLGLIFGVLGTMVIIPIVKAITKMPFQAAYTANTFLIISVVAILVGIIFGTYPAIRASRLDPVEAIRHE